MMTQGCVSESSHIHVMLFTSEKGQTFIISASFLLLCTVHEWAYALPPAQQF